MCRIISILLSFLIILNSSGYVFIYIERLASNKQKMELLISSQKNLSLFEKFIFTEKEFSSKIKWHSKIEFELNGKMYDIAKVNKTNERVIVYCIQDEKEDELISSFEKVNKTNSEKDKLHFTQTYNTSNLIAVENKLFLSEKIRNVTALSGDYFNNYRSVFLQSPTPPPKIA